MLRNTSYDLPQHSFYDYLRFLFYTSKPPKLCLGGCPFPFGAYHVPIFYILPYWYAIRTKRAFLFRRALPPRPSRLKTNKPKPRQNRAPFRLRCASRAGRIGLLAVDNGGAAPALAPALKARRDSP